MSAREPVMTRRPRGILLDLDGTLYSGEAAFPGVGDAIQTLRDAGYPIRFVTNTSRRPRRQVVDGLLRRGIGADAEEVFTAPTMAVAWMARHGIQRAAFCVPSVTLEDFEEIVVDEQTPEAVVVGDLGRDWTFERLNQAFQWLLNGAQLVAIQKNRYWKARSGLELDAGPFVAALEYAADTSATVVGKPNRDFFLIAAQSMNLPVAEVLMVGDDVENDVGGAQKAGLRGILVRTGKYREEDLVRSGVIPDAVIDSAAHLPDCLLG